MIFATSRPKDAITENMTNIDESIEDEIFIANNSF